MISDALESAKIAALAQAWRWLRDATSEEEAGEMVSECLKRLRLEPQLIDRVIREGEQLAAIESWRERQNAR